MAGPRTGEGSQTEANNPSNSWVIEVERRFNSGKDRQQLSEKLCIYRVPHEFTDSNREAYVPGYVSFGPFHHNKYEKLSAMEDHKLEAVHRTLKRLNNNKTIEDLIREVKDSDKEIRDCYEGRAIEYDRKTLAWMMTMDACFILEFLRCFKKRGEHNLVFKDFHGQNALWHGIKMDIFKLENQIPLFLLISILELEVQTREQAVSTLIEILSSFKEFQGFPFCERSELKKEHISSRESQDARHLLDLCRKVTTDFLKKSISHQSDSDPTHVNVVVIPKAELLHKAGIQFKPSGEGEVGLATNFAGSTLFLHSIIVDGRTETVLRNLIAFEECERFREHNVLSHYMCLMDNLINSTKDVALLMKEKIITKCGGSEKVVENMFNSVSNGITLGEEDQLTKIAKHINNGYQKRITNLIYKTINGLYQFQEENPWFMMSLAAFVLIFSTSVVQTVYSVKITEIWST